MKLLEYKLMWNKVFELKFDKLSIKHNLIMLEPGVEPFKELLENTEVVFNNICYKITNKKTPFYRGIIEKVVNQILDDWYLIDFKQYLKQKPTTNNEWRINWLDPDVFHLRVSTNSDTLLEFCNIDNFHMKGIELPDDILNEIKIETVRMLGGL